MSATITASAPRGGVTPMSRRVMNLAHLVTQNARRHGDRVGLVWGEKSRTWREIDGLVSALAAALAARGIGKGDRVLVHSKNCDEMFWSMFAAFRLGAELRRDVLVDVRGVPARRGLGAHEFQADA